MKTVGLGIRRDSKVSETSTNARIRGWRNPFRILQKIRFRYLASLGSVVDFEHRLPEGGLPSAVQLAVLPCLSALIEGAAGVTCGDILFYQREWYLSSRGGIVTKYLCQVAVFYLLERKERMESRDRGLRVSRPYHDAHHPCETYMHQMGGRRN